MISAARSDHISRQDLIPSRTHSACGLKVELRWSTPLTPERFHGFARQASIASSSLGNPSNRAPTKLTPARPFNLESTTNSLTAAADESGLGELLSTNAPPALVAQRFLAGLSVVALEKPGELRGIAIASSATWSPSTKLLNSITAGLTDHPLLRPLSLDAYFDEIPVATTTGGAPLVRKLTRPSEPTVPSVDEPTYRRYQRQQASFRSLLPAGDPRIARGERALHVVLSSAWTGEEGRRRAAAGAQHDRHRFSAVPLEDPGSGWPLGDHHIRNSQRPDHDYERHRTGRARPCHDHEQKAVIS